MGVSIIDLEKRLKRLRRHIHCWIESVDKLEFVDSLPDEPEEGIVYILSSDNTMRYWDGDDWVVLTIDPTNIILWTDVGVPDGVAGLDNNGQIPSGQLPSYVDDVLEFPTLTDFPNPGESGKIYVTLDTDLTYRWGGTTYVEISKSLALGTTSTTAFQGDLGDIAYQHSQVTTGNPHNVTKGDVGLSDVDNTSDLDKPISNATQNALNDKQNTLISGANIKTVNGVDLLGSGDILTPNNTYTPGTGLKLNNGSEFELDANLKDLKDVNIPPIIAENHILRFSGGVWSSSIENNTTYSEITEAEIINTGSSTTRLLTGRRAEYLLNNEASKERILSNKTLEAPIIEHDIVSINSATTLALAHRGKLLVGDKDITVPTNASVAFPIGTEINGLATDGITISGAGGVTLLSQDDNTVMIKNTGYTLIKIDTDTWMLLGALE